MTYQAEGLNVYCPGNGEPLMVLEGESLSKISASGRLICAGWGVV